MFQMTRIYQGCLLMERNYDKSRILIAKLQHEKERVKYKVLKINKRLKNVELLTMRILRLVIN